MGSNADALLITAAAAFFSFNAQSASYLAQGSNSPLSIQAIAGAETQELDDSDLGRVMVLRREIQILISDVAVPARGDQVTFADNLPWTLDVATHRDAAIAVFIAKRPITTEITHHHFRNRI